MTSILKRLPRTPKWGTISPTLTGRNIWVSVPSQNRGVIREPNSASNLSGRLAVQRIRPGYEGLSQF